MALENETVIRLGLFIGLFVTLAAAERILPRRPNVQQISKRWATNWMMSIANIFALRLVALAVPFLALGAALDAQMHGIGLLNLVEVPIWMSWLVTLLVMDFVIWLQHVVTHRWPLLWRLHQVHHADTEMDVTTAIRFHPIEIALSMWLKIGLIYSLGPPVAAVLFFEVLLNGSAMFNHANLKLSPRLDFLVRILFVTPDMHRVHHSVDRAEHDANYGFLLSIWDRLFRTHVAQPQHPHETMPIGLAWQDRRPSLLVWSLLLPFSKLLNQEPKKP